MIGTLINEEYRVDALIGHGSFGDVYACHDLTLNRTVALKIINQASTEPRERRRFIDEGRLLASLSHPNVVAIHRMGFHQDRPFLVMEYLVGKTLRSLLSGPKPSLSRVIDIMRQVSLGMKAIHTAGVVHRDLSPNNVMIMDSEEVKILDLGLAKDLKNLSTITREGRLVGTLPYVSPEQIEGRPASFASDTFAFGVILYEAVAGRHPFEAEHHMSMLYNIAHRRPPNLEDILHPIDRRLVSLIESCLEKSPEDRPEDFGEIASDLQILAAEGSLPGTPGNGTAILVPSRESAPRNPYSNRAMIRDRRDFFGRRHEIRRIFSRLNATPPGSVSMVGDRRIGKSSLLNYIYLRASRESHLADPGRMIIVFMDLHEEKNMSIETFVRILTKLTQYELRGRLDLGVIPQNLDGMKVLVERLEEAGLRLTILLDEFDSVTGNAAFDLEFFSFLRFLPNHYNVAYVTSSAQDLQRLCHTQEISDSPFFNIFTTMRVTAFRDEEAEELIRVPSERYGKPLEPFARDILDLAGYFPFYLQIACSHTLEYLEEHPQAGRPDFEEVRRRFYDEVRLHYRYLWHTLDHHSQRAVQRVSRGQSIPAALEHVLQELKARRLVEDSAEGPKLFSSTFARFIQEEGGGASEASFLKGLFKKRRYGPTEGEWNEEG